MESEGKRSFLNGVPMPLILVGPDERIVNANAEAEKLIGTSGAGRHYITVLRQPEVLDGIEATFRDGQPRQCRYMGTEATRQTLYRVTTAPVLEGGGRGVLVSFEDITHVEEAGQMRRDFVANVSHELRTPLTALLGFIETLRGAARDDAAARDRFLEIMSREAERMNRLVKDLLSLSRVESEERMRPTDRVDVAEQVASAVLSLRPMAAEAGVRLDFAPPASPVWVQGDADQLHQVFINLVENAIKYGGSGGDVSVEVTGLDHDPALRGPSATIRVRDRGMGIDPIHLPRLTERFYRVDSHRSREMGGTGLGLAIVKHIVNRHRGRLRISSEPGKGSEFTVILPRL